MQQIVDWLEKLGVSRATRASRMKLASFLLYGWFTEGFDTRDLKEAKVLLDELAA